jgi:hypothetical protein
MLGVLGALCAALTVVFIAFWVIDQSGPSADVPTLITAIVLALVTVVFILGRRLVIAAATGSPRASHAKRAG